MSNLCIIPARGGSKRIPKKNIKKFLGKPIISYSIKTALKSNLFEEVMVSTDDTTIEEISRKLGARIPFLRSKKNSNDFAGILEVVAEVMQNYDKEKKYFRNVCVIYPTAPLMNSQKLINGLNRLDDYDAVLPVTEFSYPVWRSFKIEQSGIKYQWEKFANSRSQDLPKLYHDAGQWIWLKNEFCRSNKLPDKLGHIKLEAFEVQDIDTEEDWKLAEMKYKLIHGI